MGQPGNRQPVNAPARLDPPAEEIRRVGKEAIELIAEYYTSISDQPVYPDTTAREIQRLLDDQLPEDGEDLSQLLGEFRDVVLPLNRHDGHPRFFGYVASPGTAATAIADMLASSVNPNVTSWRSAPVAAQIERLTIDWIKQIIGYDASAEGLYVSGGSMANLSALATARRVKAPINVAEDGAQALPGIMRLYMSSESHHSIVKAAGLLGIGQANVRVVSVNDHFRMDTADLATKIEADLSMDHLPFCVVANAGTVNTGAVDPLDEIIDIARHYNLWLHVDASYGGFAALAPSVHALFDRIAEADSVALDPHKWLYVPIDCGCVLYRDPAAARLTFAHEAEYTRVMGREGEEAFAFWNYGPELSRRFRALKVWVMLRHVGTRALSQAIERNIACAHYLGQLVEASEDFELLAPVQLSIFCFRYTPQRLRCQLETATGRQWTEINRELNRLNERVLTELQRGGEAYLSNARINGLFALRGCVLNYRTTEQDMEVLLDVIRRIANRLETG